MGLFQKFNRARLAALAFSIAIPAVLNAGPGNYNQQGPKLVGTGAAGASAQGIGLALSADGNTALVGGPFDDQKHGATWVFTRSNGVWEQQGQKLVGTAGTFQGAPVALTADGNTAMVGLRSSPDLTGGGVIFFTRSGGVWMQQGAPVSAETGDQFYLTGAAISADGNTLVESYHGGISVAQADEIVFVFTRSGSVWTQQGQALTFPRLVPASDLGYENFWLAISADGNTYAFSENAVCQYIDQSECGSASAVWVASRTGGVWTSQELASSDAINGDPIYNSVSLTADGNILLSGSTFFYRKNVTWSQNGPQMPPSLNAGKSCLISADGSTVIQYFNGPQGGAGGVIVYVKTGGFWIQHDNQLTGTGAAAGGNAGQGAFAALSANGDTFIESAYDDNDLVNGIGVGAAWVFTTPQLSTQLKHAGNFKRGQTGATYTLTVTNVGDRDIHAGPASAVNVIDNLPAGLIAIQITGSGWNCTLATVSCTRDDGLAMGASFPPVTVTVNVASNAPAKVTNAATASGGGSTWGNATDVTTILP